jgi:glycosyltransferase involved in cell wall biosynthesis
MKCLFIHKDLPGQFEHLIRALAEEGRNEVVCICQEFKPQQHRLAGIRVETYRSGASLGEAASGFLRSSEQAIANGLAVAGRLVSLKRAGFVPDIAFAHLGWGESLYFKDIFPDSPLVGYCEFYHHARGVDADFDPDFPLSLSDVFRIRTANATKLLGLVGIDIGVSPTEWQKSLFPAEFQRKIAVIHDGVDTARIRPEASAAFRLPTGAVLGRGQPVVTYATRNLEPYRGFHTFMRAVAEIGRRRPDCQFVIAGGDEVSYSAGTMAAESYREKLLREPGSDIDLRRVHFVGRLPFEEYLKLLQVSSVHIYLTVPFVLSWSLLEAMSAGCVVVASDTAPVREMLRHGSNGLLVDFFSPREIADMVDHVLDHPQRHRELGVQARADIRRRFDVSRSVRRYGELIGGLVSNHPRPAEVAR